MKLFLRMSMLVLLLIPLTSGCARDRNQSGISTETSGFSSAEEGAKKELELLIKNHIQTSKTYNDAAQVPVVYRRPYYLKEYSVYFNGPDAFDIAYRELESKTRPLMAEVTIEKVRFSTKMHRKKNLAREDHEFVRDTVNFLDYIGEPVKQKRQSLGILVMAFLVVFLVLAYLLKREIWRDVR